MNGDDAAASKDDEQIGDSLTRLNVEGEQQVREEEKEREGVVPKRARRVEDLKAKKRSPRHSETRRLAGALWAGGWTFSGSTPVVSGTGGSKRASGVETTTQFVVSGTLSQEYGHVSLVSIDGKHSAKLPVSLFPSLASGEPIAPGTCVAITVRVGGEDENAELVQGRVERAIDALLEH